MTFLLKPGEEGVFGGEAGALARLQGAGIATPAWFGVCPSAFPPSPRPRISSHPT